MELPEDIREVESHLTWIESIFSGPTLTSKQKSDLIGFTVCMQEASAYRSKKNLKSTSPDYQQIYQKPEENEEQDTDDDENDDFDIDLDNPMFVRQLALQLAKTGSFIYIGEFEGAEDLLKKLRESLKKLTGEHERLLEAMTYSLDALEWSMSKLKLSKSLSLESPATNMADVDPKDNENTEEKHEEMKTKLEILKQKLEDIQNDKKSLATLLFFKGVNRNNIFRRNSEAMLNYLLKVIELDPDYYIWYHYAYLSIRTVRKTEDKKIKPPYSLEIKYCQKTHDLAPDMIFSKFHLGMLLKDQLWVQVSKNIFPHLEVEPCKIDAGETFVKCLELFDETIKTAEEKDLTEWIYKSTYQKAELLLYASYDDVNRNQGMKMILELVDKYPFNGFLHARLANIYHHGIPVDDKKLFIDHQKARDQYKLALQLRQSNYFKCVKSYIKLFQKLPYPLPAKEALDILTESLEVTVEVTMFFLASDIRMWRGCVLWIYNPDENPENKKLACEDWLNTLERNDFERKADVFQILWKPPFSVYHNGQQRFAKICTDELKHELEKLRKNFEEKPKTLEAVDMLLEEIERNPRPNYHSRASQSRNDRQTQRNYSCDSNWNRSRDFRVADVSRGRRMQSNSNSMADQDDDWRRK